MNSLRLFLITVLPVSRERNYLPLAEKANSYGGRILLSIIYSILFQFTQFPGSIFVPCFLLPIIAFPKVRNLIFMVASLFFLSMLDFRRVYQIQYLATYFHQDGSGATLLIMLLAGSFAVFLCWFQYKTIAQVFKENDLIKIALAAVFFACYVGLGLGIQLQGALGFFYWTSVLYYVFPFLTLCYFLQGNRERGAPQLYEFRPFWSTDAWFPIFYSGFAKTDLELTHLLLKGIRLLLWAILLIQVKSIFLWIRYELSVPILTDALLMIGRGEQIGPQKAWVIVIANFFQFILYISIGGHVVVSLGRACGYQIHRHVYRPFESRSIADFFQRFGFHYSALLRYLFFYPVFLKLSRWSLGLRLFVAVFLSTGVANFFLCFLRDGSYIVKLGFLDAIQNYLPYAVFCLLFSVASLINLYEKNNQQHSLMKGLSRVGIFLYYAVLFIFHDTHVGNISNNWMFLKILFGF